MKKEEKELIYNLLKTADAYETGYSSKAFAVTPSFTDDVETAEKNTVKETTANRASEQGADTDTVEAVTQMGASGSTTPISGPITTSSYNSAEAVSTTENTFAPQKSSDSADYSSTPLHPSEDALPKTGLTLEELTAKIMRCTRCQLARTRNNVVPGIGVKNPEVMVIGEGPGYDEDMKGEPFVGKAGVLLDKMLNAINLDRHTNCYIANIVKCRPPQNRDPYPEEQAACISFLEAQIHILKPKMILCMGRISGQKLLNSQAPMAQLHGKVFEYNGIPLMVTYHPSALLRNEELKRPAWEDLKAFRRKLDELK